MSKKHRKARQQRKFPWLYIVIGGILLVVAGFIASQGWDGGGTPSLVVDKQQIDFGDQHFGTNLTFSIKVTNTGTGKLRFKKDPYIEIVEGC